MGLLSRLGRSDKNVPVVSPATMIDGATNRAAQSVTPIVDAAPRVPVSVRGKIRSVRVQPSAGVHTIELKIVDDTGELVVVFLGRRQIAGLEVGRSVEVYGVIGEYRGTPRMLNPTYRLVR